MLKLIPNCPVWTEQDGADLRLWLNTALSQKILSTLVFQRPEVSGYDKNQRRIQSDERAGYEACIASLLQLAEVKKE
jgi:hypothetical protein